MSLDHSSGAHRLDGRAQRALIVGGVVALLVFPFGWGFLSRYLPHMNAFFVHGQGEYWSWFVSYIVGAEWLTFAVLTVCLRRAGRSLASIGFPTRWPLWQSLTLVALAGALLAGAIAVASGNGAASSAVSPLLPVTLSERILWLFVAAPTAAIVEEVIFRGFALTYVPKLFGGRVWLAVVVQALLFAVMHGDWQAAGSAGVISFVSRFVLALVFAGLFLWRRSLKLPIVLHWLVDAAAVVSE